MGRVSEDGIQKSNCFSNQPTYTIMDLFRFTQPGVLETTPNTNNANVPAYFSIDNGAHVYYYWNNVYSNGVPNGDLGDWAPSGPNNFVPTGNDAFLNNSSPGVVNGLSAYDIVLMNILGYDLGPPSPPDTQAPTIPVDNPLSIVAGNTATITSSLLSASDNVSSGANLHYAVTSSPLLGTLLLNNVATTSFTQADINNGLVSYHETAGVSGTTTDQFFFHVTDAAGNSTGQLFFQINVSPQSTPPTITSNGAGDTATVVVGENSTAVTTVTATDPDAGTTLTYSLIGGSDQARFQINSATGALSFVSAPNFEAPTDSDGNNSYVVQVRATDNTGLFDTQTITVNVTNVNETPTITSNGAGDAATVVVGENSTAVTTVTATDPDVGTTLTYSLVGGSDHARFQINSATGALSFVSAPNSRR